MGMVIDPAVARRCVECSASPADTFLDGHGPLCDVCLDTRVAAASGLPRLPPMPDPITLADPDGGRHTMRYRVHRAPTGVIIELREDNVSDADEGFEFAVFGDHDIDPAALIAAVTAEARREIGHRYLEPDLHGTGVQTVGDQVAGRITWDPDGGPHRVVIDGRPLSWEEFGRALDSYEGWRFRLVIEDPAIDVTPDDPT